jgi:hypothetical protein
VPYRLEGIANHCIRTVRFRKGTGCQSTSCNGQPTASAWPSGPAAEEITLRNPPLPHQPTSQPEGHPTEEPGYALVEEYGTSGQADLSEFPIIHELILKDYMVVSALAVHLSGALIVSGSHDHGCK